jgi:hypothetical protein
VFHRLRALATSVSSTLDLIDERGPASVDWVIAATSAQRAAAITMHQLPPYRVLEVPALLSESELSQAEDVLRAGFVKMAGIGAPGPSISPAGVRLTRVLLRWFRGAVERAAARSAIEDFRFSDDNPWPPTATQWTTGEQAELKNRVAERIPVGRELDDILEHQARKRAKRFAALATPQPDRAPGATRT